ncbi:hypothetical protein LWM68_40795 [Niabella sp. W65]|nr:hypothetical protein [Niabella sp. W65]MCH7368512.1 hypothetical protein [Niabella sp. W65]
MKHNTQTMQTTGSVKSHASQYYKGYCIVLVKGMWKIDGGPVLPFVSLESAKKYIDGQERFINLFKR